ncbi:MAG: pilus assembly protein N-terminal domain-containing protein, partial [Burkholderiaceae bacterium]|nr:pilus assembly protein N-terminal domain-containing protein [Burkholderiaceae bacterium]
MAAARAHGADATPGMKTCSGIVITPTAEVMLGKSSVIPLTAPVTRIVVSGQPSGLGKVAAGTPGAAAAPPIASVAADAPSVADMEVLLLSPTDLFIRGKRAGATNVILQDAKGVCYLRDIVVSIDPATLQAKLAELMPDEGGIRVKSAENAIVLTGKVSDAAMLDEALRLATAYGDGKR